jgi:hypothetical protein
MSIRGGRPLCARFNEGEPVNQRYGADAGASFRCSRSRDHRGVSGVVGLNGEERVGVVAFGRDGVRGGWLGRF